MTLSDIAAEAVEQIMCGVLQFMKSGLPLIPAG
jgi:hypothetical protein